MANSNAQTNADGQDDRRPLEAAQVTDTAGIAHRTNVPFDTGSRSGPCGPSARGAHPAPSGGRAACRCGHAPPCRRRVSCGVTASRGSTCSSVTTSRQWSPDSRAVHGRGDGREPGAGQHVVDAAARRRRRHSSPSGRQVKPGSAAGGLVGVHEPASRTRQPGLGRGAVEVAHDQGRRRVGERRRRVAADPRHVRVPPAGVEARGHGCRHGVERAGTGARRASRPCGRRAAGGPRAGPAPPHATGADEEGQASQDARGRPGPRPARGCGTGSGRGAPRRPRSRPRTPGSAPGAPRGRRRCAAIPGDGIGRRPWSPSRGSRTARVRSALPARSGAGSGAGRPELAAQPDDREHQHGQHRAGGSTPAPRPPPSDPRSPSIAAIAGDGEEVDLEHARPGAAVPVCARTTAWTSTSERRGRPRPARSGARRRITAGQRPAARPV